MPDGQLGKLGHDAHATKGLNVNDGTRRGQLLHGSGVDAVSLEMRYFVGVFDSF
jgi:hypothetical protein